MRQDWLPLKRNFQALQDFRDRTGVTTVGTSKYFYEHVSDGRLGEELRPCFRLTWELPVTIFPQSNRLEQVIPNCCQTKLE